MSKSTRFVGLDDSKDSIEVAVAESGREGEVRRFGLISNTPAALRKLVRQLGRPKTLHFVYEAGPSGTESIENWCRSVQTASWQPRLRHRVAAVTRSRVTAAMR